MKASYKIFAAALGFMLMVGCESKLESGYKYPSLDNGNETLVFKLDKVFQNGVDIKAYFPFFDNVTLSLSYAEGKPSKLTFSEGQVPFSVVAETYDNVDWEINSEKTPYEICLSSTGEVICYITRDRIVTFPFQLGAPSNKYEYQLIPLVENDPETE